MDGVNGEASVRSPAMTAAKRVLAQAQEFTSTPGEPVHASIADWLRNLVAAEAVTPGDRLPPERELAQSLHVSRMTLRQALSGLESSGHLVRTVGAKGGTFIAVPRPLVDVTSLVGLSPQLMRATSATSQVIAQSTMTARPAVARALRLGDGAPVHRVVRVRCADDVPVVLERSFFPAVLLPGFVDGDLTGSLYELLRERYAREPVSAEEELVPVLPDREEAELLQMNSARPALRIIRTAFDAHGTPIEYSEDLFRGDRLRIMVPARAELAP